ncbi:MAG TPA: hypothetical protein PLL94_09870 [Bacteroidales bacterium]|nr:hypothetical protein [Bacteroidales bacterium]
MQLRKFRRIFEHAREYSKFYRKFYSDNGVLDLKIRNWDDIDKIPVVNKTILKKYSTEEIMTCKMDNSIRIHMTSGSTGEPFAIAFNKYESFTAHIRVFHALTRAGYKITDRIVMVTRYNEGDKFKIEKDISLISKVQNRLNLFQREIISIYEPVDDIILKLSKTKAKILWSTPSIMQIVANRLKEKGIRFSFPLVFLFSENISLIQKDIYSEYLGNKIVNLYGSMESPSLGYDIGFIGRFAIFPNSNLFQFRSISNNVSNDKTGNVVITNLINRTMPIIRYDLNDIAEIDEHPDFGHKYIKGIIGRQEDIIKLSNDKDLAHLHVYGMFRDFSECQMFKFVQRRDKTVILQLKICSDQDRSVVSTLALERWRKHFAEIPLIIEFVNDFEINPQTGKFKNMEIEK